ncbi:high affinity nickel transport protein nic1 [Polychaeton citri CBS 116435]|uniref:Nickel/cobalt efflux system n=1 Tax=Polychaeton citri CBS 116435 TaxID=1314669 RepID=A0A9P4Q218_9PEZI|nr:high affinity nickel transport protein nic1 [Polychaeton citri CBS 116435]
MATNLGSPQNAKALLHQIISKAEGYHERVPFFRRLPGPAIAIVLLLVFVNLVVWTACAIVLHYNTRLVSSAVLAYTFGLRHAFDADHISAIDLMTRRLIASGQRPVTVGTFFSLGHSTIVIITSIVVAASSAAITDRFGSFSDVGGIIGSSVSAVFLILLGVINSYILYKLLSQLSTAISSPLGEERLEFDLEAGGTGGGCLFPLLRRLFRLVDRPWKMYPIGVLFGLGFDTSSEIALLGISGVQAARGTSIWAILVFPVLFTAGMCMLDTFDGAAMMSLYTSARLASDPIAILYYQSVLTAITVVVAIVIGTLQLLNMVTSIRPDLEGGFWDGVAVAGDNYDIIGGSICGAFVVFGVLAVILYKPWRRQVDRKRLAGASILGGDGDDQGSELDVGPRVIVRDIVPDDEAGPSNGLHSRGTTQGMKSDSDPKGKTNTAVKAVAIDM